ncbi:whey acidic protein-like [Ochotona princeps]|uniref:whey acidic protein-like n=1 Tax=Ochotona princeps TaxID=9978 RepID=UPI0027148412|nr:whey acidic protein-like [Ochotona princeps]
MRCLISLALGLLALEAALALAPESKAPVQAMCPEPRPSEETTCTPTCHNDEDCPGNAMCCPSACGPSCRPPIIVPVSKIGRCPWVRAPLFPHLCMEKDECSNDSQCSSKKKCCLSRCAMRCLDPVAEHRRLQPAIWAPDHGASRAPNDPSTTGLLGQDGDGRSRAAPGGPRFRRPPDDVRARRAANPGTERTPHGAQLPDLASPPDWDGSPTRLPGPRCRRSPR